MAAPPYHQTADPDNKRKEILWIAISFIVILASWLAVVMLFGYQPLAVGLTYDEAVLGIGLAVLILCSILYLGVREREQRRANRKLVAELSTTVTSLNKRLLHLNGLWNTSSQLIGTLDRESIARLVVKSVVDNMKLASASLVLFDKESGSPVYQFSSPETASSDEQGGLLRVWTDQLSPNRPWTDEGRDAVGVTSQVGYVASATIQLKQNIVGILFAHRSPNDEAFTADDLNALETFANMAAKAFESSQLHAELKDSYLGTVRSLVYSLDARDNYAAAHGHRVSQLAVGIAQHMQLPEETIQEIELFAPLHDVGKIGIPDSVLLKPGPLTTEEWETCRTHVTIGERIIRYLHPRPEVLAIIRSHHESWDGSGYPDGLAGTQISLLARIVQVADAYDALMTDRPYRPVSGEDQVLAHFRINAGLKYDPVVVEALEGVLRGDSATSQSQASALPADKPTVRRIRLTAVG